MNRLILIIIMFLFFTLTIQAQGIAVTESACKTRDGFLSARMPPTPKESNDSSEEDGLGGPDPLYFDSWAGVWVDPISGLLVDDGSDFGIGKDVETGARFYKPRGLWVDPKTLKPVRISRLNDFPYYDPKTHETINPRTGERSPYVDVLLTNGATRTAAHQIRYACLGDNLRMRINPTTGKYLAIIDGKPIDDTLFDTLNASTDDRRIPKLDGNRYVPLGFVKYSQYDTGTLRDGLELTNGMSRNQAVDIIYNKFAPESPESGTYDLREARIDNGIVTQITARGLMDDSVSAVQILLFFDTSMSGHDRLLNVGVRQKCGRPNSTDAWTRKHCN